MPVPTAWGDTLHINPDDTNRFNDRLEASGTYDATLTSWFQTHTDRTTHVIDVGAYVGYYTTLAASEGATVTAFEPDAVSFDYLRRNVATNGYDDRVRCVNAAAGGTGGEATLHVRSTGRASNSLIGQANRHDAEATVDTVTLDGYGPERVDIVKIDAEGAEPAIIRGAALTIRRDRPVIVMEWSPKLWDERPGPTLSRLAEWGYHPQALDGGALSIADLITDDDAPANLLFVPWR